MSFFVSCFLYASLLDSFDDRQRSLSSVEDSMLKNQIISLII